MAETKKEEKKMTAEMPKVEKTETPKTETKSLLKTQEVKQKIKVIDLDNPEKDDVQVEIVYNKYDFDSKADQKLLAAELDKLVTPLSERNLALAKYATSAAYQKGKDAAMATGNYLGQDLKTAIVDFLRMTGRFNDNTAKEIFTRWLDGYRGNDPAKKASAKKILDRVSDAQDMADAL